MKLFNIYIKKSSTKDDIIQDLVVVKSGFSFLAFLFNIIWFLQHKMWKESITLTLVNVTFIIILKKELFGLLDAIILEFGLALIIGLNATYWYEQYLRRNQYQFLGCVFGKNAEEARLRFVSNCFKDKEESIFCPSIANIR